MQQDMDALRPPNEPGQVFDLLNIPRSPQWPAVQHACLEQNQNKCVACGLQGAALVQVHHIIPFQYCVVYGRPELEFNPKNLIPLCEGPGTNDHHIAIGHLGDFQHLNQDVLTDISGPWKGLTNAEIEILPEFIARKKWPTKPVSLDDQNALAALMNQLYGPKPQASIGDLIKEWWPKAGAIAAVSAIEQALNAGDNSAADDSTNAPTSGTSGN
jgi:hypothetical protein